MCSTEEKDWSSGAFGAGSGEIAKTRVGIGNSIDGRSEIHAPKPKVSRFCSPKSNNSWFSTLEIIAPRPATTEEIVFVISIATITSWIVTAEFGFRRLVAPFNTPRFEINEMGGGGIIQARLLDRHLENKVFLRAGGVGIGSGVRAVS
ncbi:hypothetical protein TIFTF001_017349 [Ficus carica]|uniref:Uncharacterized protein n=1 Tax=Ficus carica TaxID=3494 RepID=A0AA88A221_FICCA|nr:hypothetical protein TIFTF001_017349 [Ficus carica]